MEKPLGDFLYDADKVSLLKPGTRNRFSTFTPAQKPLNPDNVAGFIAWVNASVTMGAYLAAAWYGAEAG